MSAPTTSTGVDVPKASLQTRLVTEDVLAELLDALREPGAIHPGLAASVVEHARTLLQPKVMQARQRGTAFTGRLIALDGLPGLTNAEQRQQLL